MNLGDTLVSSENILKDSDRNTPQYFKNFIQFFVKKMFFVRFTTVCVCNIVVEVVLMWSCLILVFGGIGRGGWKMCLIDHVFVIVGDNVSCDGEDDC